MPTVCEITLKSASFKKQLDDVVSDSRAAAQKMGGQFGTAAGKISQTGTAAKDMSGSMKDAAGKISQAGGAIGALSGALGGINPQLAVLGQALSAIVTGPLGLLVLTVGTAISLGVKLWDYWTLSADEYAAKLSRATAAAQKMKETVEKENSTAQGYLNRLRDLSSAESLSNEGKKEAARLLAVLSGRYGDLGLSIDAVTGKISGFDAAQRALDVKTAQKRIGSARKEFNDAKREEENRRGATLVETKPFGQTMKMFGRTFSSIEESKAAFSQMSPEQQLDAYRQLQDNAKTNEEVDKWQKLIDLKERQFALEKQIKMLEKHQVRSEEELDAKERLKTEQGNAEKKLADDKAKSEREKKDAFDSLIQERIDGYKDEIAAADALKNKTERQYKIEKEIAELRKKAKEAKQDLSLEREAELRAAVSDAYDRAQSDKREAEARKKELEGKKDELDALRQDAGRPWNEIQTNELTARGGFSTGVVDKDDVNKEIRDYASKIHTLVETIKKLEEEGNRT